MVVMWGLWFFYLVLARGSDLWGVVGGRGGGFVFVGSGGGGGYEFASL